MLHIVLSDDWELRGNGSGNPRALQLKTARALMDLFERFSLRCSFNAEVLRQLAFREAAAGHGELGLIADEWDACVREMLRRGHDVQLHTHPQRDGAAFEGGRFRMNPECSLQSTGMTVFFPDENIDTGAEMVLRLEDGVSDSPSLDAAKRRLFDRNIDVFRMVLASLQNSSSIPMHQEPGEGRRFYVMSGLPRGVTESDFAARRRHSGELSARPPDAVT